VRLFATHLLYPLPDRPFRERRRIARLVKSGGRIANADDRSDAELVYGWHYAMLTAPIARGFFAVLWIMVAFAIVGLGLSLTTDRWGMTAFFVLSLAFYIFIIVGGRWQERRVWTQLLRAASVNGWASPSGLD